MLNETFVNGISKFFQHACYLKFLPFDWNPKTLKISVIRDSRIYITLSIHTYITLNCIILTSSYYIYHESMSISTQALHIVWISSYLMSVLNCYSNFSRRDQFARFLNDFLSHPMMILKAGKFLQRQMCHLSPIQWYL